MMPALVTKILISVVLHKGTLDLQRVLGLHPTNFFTHQVTCYGQVSKSLNTFAYVSPSLEG